MRISLLFLLLALNASAEVVVIVNAKYSGLKLTADQVSSIFLGKKVPAPDGSMLIALNQSEGKPIREKFMTKVTGKDDSQLKAYWAKMAFTGKGDAPKEVGGDADVKKMVATNPNTVGYIDKSAADSSVVVVYSVE